jgi:hypothetical protein
MGRAGTLRLSRAFTPIQLRNCAVPGGAVQSRIAIYDPHIGHYGGQVWHLMFPTLLVFTAPRCIRPLQQVVSSPLERAWRRAFSL